MAPSSRRALTALLLLVPVPTIGVLAALWLWPDTAVGEATWTAGKIWILVLPLVWRIGVDRERPRVPAPRRAGMGLAVATGLLMAAVVAAAYLLLGPMLIDPEQVAAQAAEAGLDSRGRFLAMALYISFINALLEEYVWRWFVFSRCRALVSRSGVAILLAAACFALHHVLILAAYFDAVVTVLGTAGILAAGAIWSWLYLRSGNIWAPYISHVLADIAVFIVAYVMIFG